MFINLRFAHVVFGLIIAIFKTYNSELKETHRHGHFYE